MLQPNLQNFDAAKKTGFFEFISRNIREIITFRHALFNFIGSALSSRYRRSAIGFFWSLLNPLFTMLVMAIVFSSLYKLPFATFSLYLFSGLLPWNLTTSSIMEGSRSLLQAEAYLKKVYIPKTLFPLVTLGIEVVNFLLSLISLFFLAFIFGSKFSLNIIYLPLALFVTCIFLFGLILIVSLTTVFFRDLLHIIQIIMLGMFYLTPILYSKTMLSESIQALVDYNPFYYFINLFHLIIYEGKFPTFASWWPCIILAIGTLSIGVFIFYKKEDDIIYRL